MNNSRGQSYTQIAKLDLKYRFSCRDLNFHGNTLNYKDITSPTAGSEFHLRNTILNFWTKSTQKWYSPSNKEKVITIIKFTYSNY